MFMPEISSSTREERINFVKEQFSCMNNCENCGKCSFLKGLTAEELYAEYIEGRRSFAEITAEHRRR